MCLSIWNFLSRWGDGGVATYRYALAHPEMVASLLFLDVYPQNIEFKVQRDLKNLTQQEYYTLIQTEMSQRLGIITLINAIGVPFGLMDLVLPSYQNSSTPFANEQRYFFLTEKTWGTQKYFIDLQATTFKDNTDPYKKRLPLNIPINMVITKHSDEYVIKTMCTSIPKNSPECIYQIKANRYMYESQLSMVNLNGGKVVKCILDECSQAYYVFINPHYTVEVINSLFE